MAICRPVFSGHFDLAYYTWWEATNKFLSLANGSAMQICMLDMEEIGAMDFRMSLDIKSGNIQAPGTVSVVMCTSINGVNFTDGRVLTDWTSQQVAVSSSIFRLSPTIYSMPIISGNVVNYSEFSLLDRVASIPRYVGLYLVNNSTAALDGVYLHQILGTSMSYEYL